MKRFLKTIVSAAAIAAASVASAQGLQRPTPQPEITLWSAYRAATMSGAASIGGHKLPASRGFSVSGVTYNVNAAAGTATATMVFQITDGTSTCSVAFDCTTNDARTTGTKGPGVLSGTCFFPAGAALSGTISTACSTAQPGAVNIDVVGTFR